MKALRAFVITVAALAAFALQTPAMLRAQDTISGERLAPTNYGPSYIESMADAIARDRLAPLPENDKDRKPGEQGVWMVPSLGATTFPHSGPHNAVNKWGDTRLGIGFPRPVDVQGAYFAGQAASGAWTTGLRVLGFRDGQRVQETEWFHDIGAEPHWLAMNLRNVDRIEILSVPVLNGGGWYGMDDLTYTISTADGTAQTIVVDFDDLPFGTKLTGSNYAGLTWETGSGDFTGSEGVHGPLVPPGFERQVPPGAGAATVASGTRATAPSLIGQFQGVLRGDAGSMSYPPDTIGAVGTNHYVETVNRNFAVYDKFTGAELTNILLGSFLPGSNGDPRVLYDQHSGRWIVLVTDFDASATYFLAVSLTNNPMGNWFKTSFVTAQGSDVGRWPDYPTLGVDSHGIYSAAYMVPGGMTIFAIDKAPLVGPSPHLGTVTAFRSLPWEGAIQPAHTFGTPSGEYLVSWSSSTALRIRRVNPPLTGPTLTEVGQITVSSFGPAADAPALGSYTNLDTVDERLMMATYRAGSLWCAHTINVSGRAGCRWYQLDPVSLTVVQWGNVADSALWYFFPSIMVNEVGDVVMGFTGSNASQYAGCYFTGRKASDPLGQMATPVQYKPGTGPQNNIDGYGRNRWGDYSYTTLDPSDEMTFYTIQEYGHSTDIWGTYVGMLVVTPPLDCNGNGIPDQIDIANGISTDCNSNGVPDECDPLVDCNANGVLDDCDLQFGTSPDCNTNNIPDECDIANGVSQDCDANDIPDDCEVGLWERITRFDLDTDPGWSTTGEWAFGQPTGQGGGGTYGFPDPTSGFTGTNVYGVNLNGDYSTTYGGPYYLTTGPLDLHNIRSTHLRFQRWLNSDYWPYVGASVEVSHDGSTWQTVWFNGGTVIKENAWSLKDYDISVTADYQPAVYVRWGYQIGVGAQAFSGWNIDDIEVVGLAPGGGPNDCNANQIPDSCDIASGTSQDCNTNGVPDECDIANGTSQDANGNGIPDECDSAVNIGDLNCDGGVNFGDINPFVLAVTDLAAWQAAYPGCPVANADINSDGTVNFGDINPFVALLTGGK
jgi:hypothetical protein